MHSSETCGGKQVSLWKKCDNILLMVPYMYFIHCTKFYLKVLIWMLFARRKGFCGNLEQLFETYTYLTILFSVKATFW